MNDASSEALLAWIKRLNRYCQELNDALIAFYNLPSQPALADWEPFSRPGRAGGLGLIPRRGSFDFSGQQASYWVHGAGISFTTPAVDAIAFQYFPQPADCRRPILSSWSIKQFICSIDPANVFIANGILDETLDNLFAASKITQVHDGYSSFYLRQTE